MKDIDYGPLQGIIGVWSGSKGIDHAPEPEDSKTNPYHETITYTAIGNVSNAESQVLSVVHYLQIVQHKSNDEVFHHETGYWIWDAKTETVMHSLAIPRAVCVLAGGKYSGEKDTDGNVIIEVSAGIQDENWGVIQSPFMKANARTTGFRHKVIVGNGTLSYLETTVLDIYGKTFEDTDQNELTMKTTL